MFRLAPVADASPALELNARIGERQEPVRLIGLDMLRALTVTPEPARAAAGQRSEGPASTRAAGADAALDPEAMFLSRTLMDGPG
jgi:hypothetical protein